MNLTYAQMKALVAANNKSTSISNECVIAVCWKETNFNPNAHSGSSSASGLMQMTTGAIGTVNNITPNGVHYKPADMTDPAKAIQCGTYFLEWCYGETGTESDALNKYGGVGSYSTNVMTAERCLKASTVADPIATCLKPIHPFLDEREKIGLIDDTSGSSRFVAKPRKQGRPDEK